MRAHLHARIAIPTTVRHPPGQVNPQTRANHTHIASTCVPHLPLLPQPTNTELILYSYAQLTGTLQITPIRALPTTDQLQMLNALRSALYNRAMLG
jgi:hypothetical protein